MAIGTGTTAPTASDTQLENEVFRATTGDAPLNWVDDPDTPGRYEAKLSVTGGDEVPAGTQITEAALIIGSESQLYSRDVFGVKEPGAGESVTSTMPILGPV
ncbi:hypothetical protein [Halococcus saccharolyticus]|uniref:Uncharacterized protein n=1 Tax=Halococcus saccharolyticus DSM 5350 TaxID=1227455 RepID=M0MRJ9_9EURY|nr:hypothetical protein [Halococcus saccharolyticus]EMA47983.1 hypothetical protein C449_00885 [Halococcus saccharolyticus DSM 5350]